MYHFEYVSKNEVKVFKKSIIEIIHEVQDLVRDDFTFNFTFVGSCSRNMVTCDYSSNIGFDLDVNIEVNDDLEEYEPYEIRKILVNAFNKVRIKHGYYPCKESTRVFTIRYVDRINSRIINSCDFAIVYNYTDNSGRERQQYIRYNKTNNSYTWELQGSPYYLDKKITYLKRNDLWEDVQDYYIEKKNSNNNPDKHSRSIFAETINEMYSKNFNNNQRKNCNNRNDLIGEDMVDKLTLLSEMYDEACVFKECGEWLKIKMDEAESVKESFKALAPMITNYSFSCELFLKLANSYFDYNCGKKHKLNSLFDSLPIEAKEEIKQRLVEKNVKWNDVWGLPNIDNIANVFVEWRYEYEFFTKEINKTVYTYFLINFCEVLQQYCFSLISQSGYIEE